MKLLTVVCVSMCVAAALASPVKRGNSNRLSQRRTESTKPANEEYPEPVQESLADETVYAPRSPARYPQEAGEFQPQPQSKPTRKRIKSAPKIQSYDPVPASSNQYPKQYDSYDYGAQDSESQQFEQSVQAAAAANTPGENKYGRGNEKDGRLHFAIHGQYGPESYKFGYDTGKGDNRQFRYEEKDAEGVVHGRYGYYDKNGKLQVVNYTAHPKYGFTAH